MPKQRSRRQRRRPGVGGDRADRQVEERRRDLRVDPLVRLDLAVAEVEERLPADEAPRGAGSRRAGRRDRRRCSELVEDEAEERLAVVAGEVGAVGRADHAVAEAVGGALELDRDERLALARPVEAPAASEHGCRPSAGRRRAAGTRAGSATGSARSSAGAPAVYSSRASSRPAGAQAVDDVGCGTAGTPTAARR